MPQVLILIAIGAGIYAGSKWVGRELGKKRAARSQASSEQVRSSSAMAADRGALEFDPKENVYRPKA
jgi:hypothetical protein